LIFSAKIQNPGLSEIILCAEFICRLTLTFPHEGIWEDGYTHT
jgi:hypothetical protein